MVNLGSLNERFQFKALSPVIPRWQILVYTARPNVMLTPTITTVAMNGFDSFVGVLASVTFRGRVMEERLPLLRGKVTAEAKAMDKKLADLANDWEAGRPLSKDNTPSKVQS